MSSPLQLTQEQARALLVRSHFLDERAAHPDEVVKRLVAIQTQYVISLPVALAARSKVPKGYPDRAFNKNPSLYKTWTLRSTIHVHHVDDWDLLLGGLARHRYDRIAKWQATDIGMDGLARQEERILEALAKKPLTRVELHEKVPELKDLPYTGWGFDVMGLAFKGEIIIAPSGPGATKFARPSLWLKNSPTPLDPDQARAELLRRYLLSHAPATLADFAYWAGMKMVPARQALQALKNELITVEVEGLPGTRYMLQEQAEATIEPIKGVRLLAKFDPLMMGHKDKRLVLPEKLHPRVFRKAGQVEATVLKDGQVVGAWRLIRGAKTAQIQLEPFKRLSQKTLRTIAREAKRLKPALGLADVTVAE